MGGCHQCFIFNHLRDITRIAIKQLQQFTVFIDRALVKVNQEHLTGSQTTAMNHHLRIKINEPRLRTCDH